ncbi:hypothetical protein ABEX08_22870 [Priestia megaterium]
MSNMLDLQELPPVLVILLDSFDSFSSPFQTLFSPGKSTDHYSNQ